MTGILPVAEVLLGSRDSCSPYFPSCSCKPLTLQHVRIAFQNSSDSNQILNLKRKWKGGFFFFFPGFMTSLCRCCTLCKNGDWLQLARWHQRRTFVPVVQPLLLPWRFLICYADTGIDLGEAGGGGLGSHGVNDAALQPCYGVTVSRENTLWGSR